MFDHVFGDQASRVMALDNKCVAFDTLVMGNKRGITDWMIVMTAKKTARMPSTTTPHHGVRGVLVELVFVLFQV